MKKNLIKAQFIKDNPGLFVKAGYLKSIQKTDSSLLLQREQYKIMVEEATSYLAPESSNRARMKYYLWDITPQNIKCPVKGCSKNIIWNTKKSVFKSTCGLGDQEHILYINSFRHKKAKQSITKKYGVDNVFKIKEVQDAIQKKHQLLSPIEKQAIVLSAKKTSLKRYGVDHYSKSDEFKDSKDVRIFKGKETSLKRYGVDYYSKTTEFKENRKKIIKSIILKSKETCIKRYGVEHYAKSDEFKEKYKETCLERYGVINYAKSDDFKEKYKETCIERYDVEHYAKSDEFKEKMHIIMPTLTNEENIKLSFDDKMDLLKTDLEAFLTPERYIKLPEMCQFYECSKTSAYKIFRRLGITVKKRKGTSIAENQILEWIKVNYPDLEIIQGTRSIIGPREIDIYLPELKLAIEYNGIMFHTAGESKHVIFNTPHFPKDYHIKKTEMCEDIGIQLIHIREDEYQNFQDKIYEDIKIAIDYKIDQLNNLTIDIELTEQFYIVPRDRFSILSNFFIDSGYKLIDILPPQEHLIFERRYHDSGMLVYEKMT